MSSTGAVVVLTPAPWRWILIGVVMRMVSLLKPVGRVLFWILIAPILMVIDLSIMLVRFDRDRLEAAWDNTRAFVVHLFSRR